MIMSLNTYDKNVDIIRHYYIILIPHRHVPYQAMVSENDQLSQILRKTH
jgi:hypothetical protein